ncbi:hypothetical protein BGX28_002948 [Mortierella sp. GBA30]|nr:hypothetical protein BGX28_002948 [Mortierella sp. GBA30]
MLPTYNIIYVLLTALTGFMLLQYNLGLVQAYQDPAHYFLPANIYDNLPPGVETPIARGPLPPQPTVLTRSADRGGSDDLSPGPDSPPTIEITNPLLNAVYVPGSNLFMTWANNGIHFPENWTPPKEILDLITNDPNFSHSPLLTTEDMKNLAEMKLEELKRAQLTKLLKESPIYLHSLRLVSWPLQSFSDISTVNAGYGGGTTIKPAVFSPNILNDPGYNLANVSQMTLLGGAGGQMTWLIPEDWAYEGEFEIRIPSVGSGTGTSSTSSSGTAITTAVTNKDSMYAKSRPFWILRDSAMRAKAPQYNLPSMDQQQRAVALESFPFSDANEKQRWHEREMHRQRDMGIFLGVAAMLLAFVLVGIGTAIGIYRRKWVKDQQQQHQQNLTVTDGAIEHTTLAVEEGGGEEPRMITSTSLGGTSFYGTTDSLITTTSSSYSQYTSSSMAMFAKRQKQQQGSEKLIKYHTRYNLHSHPLELTLGDEDAHSPFDLNDSEETLDTTESGRHAAENEITEKDMDDGIESNDTVTSPAETSETSLPLYKTNDSFSSLAT